jgi:hypothetical protein
MINNVIGSSAVITSFHNEQQEDDQLSDIQNKLIMHMLLRVSGLSNGVLTYHIANREIRTDNC